MLWAQALPGVAIWLAFIYVRREWVQGGRTRYAGKPRATRIALMLASIMLSLAILVSGFLMLTSQPTLAAGGTLTALGIAFVAIMGLLFLHFQMLALTLTLSLAFERETPTLAPASEHADNSGESQ